MNKKMNHFASSKSKLQKSMGSLKGFSKMGGFGAPQKNIDLY